MRWLFVPSFSFMETPTPKTPVPFTAWNQQTAIREGMMYREAALDQFEFVITLAKAVGSPDVWVVGEHVSKSIVLPVYELRPAKQNTIINLRGNFADWVVSVRPAAHGPSLGPNLAPVAGRLFDTTAKESATMAEGLNRAGLVFGSFADNPWRFTLRFYEKYDLYTMLWLLARSGPGPLPRPITTNP